MKLSDQEKASMKEAIEVWRYFGGMDDVLLE